MPKLKKLTDFLCLFFTAIVLCFTFSWLETSAQTSPTDTISYPSQVTGNREKASLTHVNDTKRETEYPNACPVPQYSDRPGNFAS